MDNKQKLLFVYNANSDLLSETAYVINDVLDTGKNDCGLCKVTHNTFGEKKTWRAFINSLSIPTDFLHRDEFQESYAAAAEEFQLPVVLLRTQEQDSLQLVLSSEAINVCESQDELRGKLLDSLDQFDIS